MLRFDAAMWDPGPTPAWLVGEDRATLRRYEGIRQWRAWGAAGRAWLAEHGHPAGDYFALVHPEVATLCGMRLQGDYSAR